MEQPRVMGFHTCALSIQTFKSETPSAIKLMWVCSMRSSRQQQTDPPQLLTSPASHHPSHQLTQLDPPASRRSRGQQYAADGRHWVAVCHTCNKRCQAHKKLLGKRGEGGRHVSLTHRLSNKSSPVKVTKAGFGRLGS
eukprot:scaffold154871_cov15-Tisochrysis_lutea.AAC.4